MALITPSMKSRSKCPEEGRTAKGMNQDEMKEAGMSESDNAVRFAQDRPTAVEMGIEMRGQQVETSSESNQTQTSQSSEVRSNANKYQMPVNEQGGTRRWRWRWRCKKKDDDRKADARVVSCHATRDLRRTGTDLTTVHKQG